MSIMDMRADERKAPGRRSATITTLLGSAAGTLVVTLQAVVLIPLYISHIGPRLYGAWLASGDVLVWMQAFDLGLPNLMIQRIALAYAQEYHRSVGEWFATGAAMLGCVAALIVVAGLGISIPLPGFFGLTGDDAVRLRQCFQVAVVAACVSLFNNVFVGFSRAVQDTAFLNFVGIASTVASLITSSWLVLRGAGLWALPLGLTTRALLALAGSIVFVWRYRGVDLKRHFRYNHAIAKEFAAISPATALGGLGYSLMTQSDTAIVGMLRSPELATVYSVTRKLMDACRTLIDQVAFASYGGFAHLVGSPERGRSLQVHAEIRSVRLWLAFPAAAVCMAINQPLVRLWVGGRQFGGPALTILLALQMIVGGDSYLVNYLYRAAGSVKRGSLALAAEASVRVPLAMAFTWWLGIWGTPIGAILAASVSAAIVMMWTRRELSAFATPPRGMPVRILVARALIFSAGVALCLTANLKTWYSVASMAAVVGAMAMCLLLWADPDLSGVRLQLRTWAGTRGVH